MTLSQIRKRMEGMRVADLDEMRSQLEQLIRDDSQSDKKRDESRTVLRICEDVLHKKNTMLNMQRVFGFSFDPTH